MKQGRNGFVFILLSPQAGFEPAERVIRLNIFFLLKGMVSYLRVTSVLTGMPRVRIPPGQQLSFTMPCSSVVEQLRSFEAFYPFFSIKGICFPE
jgi:hypothetical protein